MSGFALKDNLVLIAVWSVTIARNKFSVKSFLSKFLHFSPKSSCYAIHILLFPQMLSYILIIINNFEVVLHLSKVIFEKEEKSANLILTSGT